MHSSILSTITSNLSQAQQEKVKAALQNATSDTEGLSCIEKLSESQSPSFTNAQVERLQFLYSLATLTNYDAALVKALEADESLQTLRDVALSYNQSKLASVYEEHGGHTSPPMEILSDGKDIAAAKPAEPARPIRTAITQFQRKLFWKEPTAVIQRMIQEKELPLANDQTRSGVLNFFANQPAFNIRQTSVVTALRDENALVGIPQEHVTDVTTQLKTLQLAQALTPDPQVLPALLKKGMTSALKVASMPENTFVQRMGNDLDSITARAIHSHAVTVNMRNNRVLTHAYQTIKGTGLAAIDGAEKRPARIKRLLNVASTNLPQVDLEMLFGSLDSCECSDCTSVFSPSAYYVELLQFLRNNDLDPNPGPTNANYQTGDQGTSGTLLDILFSRRPDLGCLELSCANTNTVLPYIDLANEVMESYVVYLLQQGPASTSITVFNVLNETSDELLAAPQNTNYEAYCILNSAVYPPQSLPYCQPIDSMRINLKYLGTSRYELMTVFQEPYTPPLTAADGTAISIANQQELATIHQKVLTRAADAEFLSIIQGEYIILCKEAFWPKEYFDITQNQKYTPAQYQTNIGFQEPNEYWGLSLADMKDESETKQIGLMFVEAQLLRRSGLAYADLASVLKTTFINPDYPQGKALVTLENIQFSYRFLQRLVDTSATSKKKRFAKLIKFLMLADIVLPKPDDSTCGCQGQSHASTCSEISQLCCWVYQWFDRVGHLIVLESGEGPLLPFRAEIYADSFDDKLSKPADDGPTNTITQIPPIILRKPIATLERDGTIVDYESKKVVAYVQITGQVLDTSGNLWVTSYTKKKLTLTVESIGNSDKGGQIRENGYLFILGDPLADRETGLIRITWTPQQDDCNLDNVRLRHLDGTAVTAHEYYRLHVFLRLWRKMGWSIDEVDKAIIGLTPVPVSTPLPTPAPSTGATDEVTFGDFTPSCSTGTCGSDSCTTCGNSMPHILDSCSCDTIANAPVDYHITPDLLHQFVAFVQLLSLTSLEAIQQLAWFTDIDTVGPNSLYAQLFLTTDAEGIDPVFEADANGNYLTAPNTISAHQAILLSVFRLDSTGLAAIISYAAVPDTLTLSNVSLIYRYASLASVLQVKPSSLPDYIAMFGNPFTSGTSAVSFLQTANSMTSAGFNIAQVLYIVRGVNNNPLKPLGPTQLQVLKTSKTIFDGINAINTSNPFITTTDTATDNAVLANATLLLDPTLVQQIIGFLDGTTIYTTNAPSGLSLTIPGDLSQKLAYNNSGTNSTISTVGQLTPSQVTEAKALTSNTAWTNAIDRLGKQGLQFFNQNLAGIFSNTADAIANLVTPGDSGTNSPSKRLYFLTYFIPYLTGQLCDQLVITTLASAVGLDNTTTAALLSDVLVSGGETAITAFRSIANNPTPNPTDWTGYLIPPTTDNYTFSLQSDAQPASMTLNGQSIAFPNQQDDPNNVWLSNPVNLIGGRSYSVEIPDPGAAQIQWKTIRSIFARIPSSALLPDYTTSLTSDLFTAFFKAAMIVNGFSLSVDEILFFQSHSSDFSGFDLNSPSLAMWQRMIAYTTLRGSFSNPTTTLLGLFIWANNTSRTGDLVDTVAAATSWTTDYINALVAPFTLTISSFKNEIPLIQMQKAVTVAQKTSIPIPSLFSWAKPLAKFWEAHQIATTIAKAIRAKYSLSDWEQVVTPLNNQLRADQQTALSAYLMVQPSIQSSGVVDLNSLFNYFLIDAQMRPCFKTSRLKQATSSVQVFIQRCLLGLEGDDPNIQNIDRNRWNWMSKYRVWQANREVFLYPENYMVSSLRDDKSPFYKELESELLQKDVTLDTVLTAVKNYLYSVDEVANLQVVGLFVQDTPPATAGASPTPAIIHVFGRTPHSPYVYFYRNYDVTTKTWTSWDSIKVDIPNNDIEIQGRVLVSGTYVVPFVYAGRLMIAIPQFSIKTIPQPVYPDTSPLQQGNAAPAQPSQCYQIQLGFSEYQNGAWTQKQLSSTALYTPPVPTPPLSTATAPPDVSAPGSPVSLDPASLAQFQFVPILSATDPMSSEAAVYIDVYQNYVAAATKGQADPPVTTADLGFVLPATVPTPTRLGRFVMVGSQLTVANSVPSGTTGISAISGGNTIGTVFHYLSTTDSNGKPVWRFQSLQAVATENQDPSSFEYFFPTGSQSDPFLVDYMQPTTLAPTGSPVNYTPTQRLAKVTYEPGYQTFSNPWSSTLLGTLTSTNDLDSLYAALSSLPSSTSGEAFGQVTNTSVNTYNELSCPNSIYSWEVGFHAPMALVNSLLNTQQFDLALKVLAYIFDPLAQSPTGSASTSRFWKFQPFQNVNAQDTLLTMFNELQPNKPDNGQYGINDWRNDPFEPFLVGRDRPVAFMKWVAMTYINIMIAYGDYYFQQNTLETIPLALECYIQASNAYGPRGQVIPKRGKKQIQTYNSLVDNWDAFSNAQVQLELAFPFSNQTQFPIGYSNGVAGLANIWGFATELYFCVPANAQLASIRDTIDDRLFKIRHCENIQGIVESLPLYEPPINPALLVAATAQGLSLASVVNSIDAPMPNYRFSFMLQKALDICGELKSLGASFLLVKEKEDGEGLGVLRAANELTLNNLIMQSRTLSLSEAQAALDTLNQSRLEPEYRMQANLQLIGGDVSTIPGPTSDFAPANDNIEIPQASSGLKLIQSEIDEVNNATQAAINNQNSGNQEVQAGLLHQYPDVGISVTPWGVGVSSSYGPSFIAAGTAASARGLSAYAQWLTAQSSSSARTTGYKRNAINHSMNGNSAGFQIKNIDKQILAQQVRISLANQEITNQQQQIDNSQAVSNFLLNKYTNQQLYVWMEGNIKTIYYQLYQIAYGWAKKAEKTFQFDRALQSDATNSFINFGYWDNGHDGLLAGEMLYQDLKSLEAAYNETRGWDFEVTKFYSMRLNSPLSLHELRATGNCQFAVPEILFDMDFPGHYLRKIRSVTVTIPCVVGPYTTVNATLRLLSHQYRTSSIATSANDYVQSGPDDARFATANIPITAIAVSSGQNDSGVFELNFRDERYMPFENAGAVSTWQLSLPTTMQQFSYDSITDVVVQIRYTSVDGGQALGGPASSSVASYLKTVQDTSSKMGLFSLFDLKNEFSSEWYRAMQSPVPTGTTARTLSLPDLTQRLPIYTRGTPAGKIIATDLSLAVSVTAGQLDAGQVTLAQAGGNAFSDGPAIGGLQQMVMEGASVPVGAWVFTVNNTTAVVDQMWLMIRYTLNS